MHLGKEIIAGRILDNRRLENALKAHRAVCDMLDFVGLTPQTERQLNNLKRLLELEISAARAEGESKTQDKAAD